MTNTKERAKLYLANPITFIDPTTLVEDLIEECGYDNISERMVGELFGRIADACPELTRQQLRLIHQCLAAASVPILEKRL